MTELISRQEAWRRAYLHRPYFQFSSEQEVAERLRHIMENMTVLHPDGKIGVLPPEPHGKLWLRLFQNVIDEYNRRGIKPPNNFLKGAHIPHPTHPSPSPTIRLLHAVSPLPDGSYLIKYGQREHMSELLEYGRLRITPASFYLDPSLNDAIQDDELTVTSYGLQSETVISFFDKSTGAFVQANPIGNITRRTSSIVDYYIYCLSTVADLRLFGDFGYNACVVIRNYDEFKSRLAAAVARELPGWIGSGGPVQYVDPFCPVDQNAPVYHCKHHKFWYQREYRSVWTPPVKPKTQLKPFFVELGSIRSFAELIVLDGDCNRS